jgi:hypothetical protein
MVRVLLLAALLASTAHAADDVRCKQIGEFARKVAQARNEGIAKEAVLAKLPAGDSPARRTVEGIYRDPAMAPDQAAGLELTCLLDAARENPNTYQRR